MSTEMNIVLAGVGGQGTLVAGKVLGAVAEKIGMDFKVSEVHGMSQRGGSVITYVRIGPKVFSPVIENKMADFILGFEQLEALRWVSLLKNTGIMIMNDQKIMPATVLSGSVQYPENIEKKMIDTGLGKKNFIVVPAYKISLKAGNVRAVNMVMIGTMSNFTDIKESVWIDSIKEILPDKLHKINIEAFLEGKKSYIIPQL